MVRLHDGEKSLGIQVTILTEYWRVTDRQTDILRWHSLRCAHTLRSKNHNLRNSTNPDVQKQAKQHEQSNLLSVKHSCWQQNKSS